MFVETANVLKTRIPHLSYIKSIRDSLLISFTSASVESVIDRNSSSSAGGVLGGVTKESSVYIMDKKEEEVQHKSATI